MTASTPKTIYELFAAVKSEVGPVGKTSHNDQQNFNFRGVDAVVNAAAGALNQHSVIIVPTLRDVEYATVETGKNRTLMGHARVQVQYTFYGPAGDSFTATVPGEAMDSGDKAVAKAMSVAWRICLIQTLNLPTGDPDPDKDTYQRSAARDESWRDQPPVNKPRGNGRPTEAGSPTGRSAAAPAATSSTPAHGSSAAEVPPDAPVDAEAQAIAGEAHEARTVQEISALHGKAHDAGKLAAVVEPRPGKKGTLKAYLDWRRDQIRSEARAVADWVAAGKATGLEGDVLNERFLELTGGVNLEDATVKQIKEATAALSNGAPA